MFLLLWAAARAGDTADAWWLESPEMNERAGAEFVEASSTKAGFSVRVVKRFHLGEGWEYVALVEGFADQAAAADAARTLKAETGVTLTLVHDPAKGRAVRTEVDEAAPERASAGVIAACLAAHGGPTGGVAALARSPAVHFSFERTLDLDGRQVVMRHDYWRDTTSRRLLVEAKGGGVGSLMVASAAGAWIRVGDKLDTRDIGVVVTQADAFAPEAVLAVALDIEGLFGAGEDMVVLEGAESGTRVGRGEDPTEPGLAFADLDLQTGRLVRVRYVTEGGPVLFELDAYRSSGSGVTVPGTVTLTRADGRREIITVKRLELLDSAPAGTFRTP